MTDNKNEWITVIPNILNESHIHSIEWNKQDTKENIVYDSIHMKFKNRLN